MCWMVDILQHFPRQVGSGLHYCQSHRRGEGAEEKQVLYYKFICKPSK
jgi:hypothetical protein